jgi:thiamine biosynthesis lipoprotein
MPVVERQAVAWQWRAMGTTWRLYHRGGIDADVAGAVRTVVEGDEARWSRFRPGSELSRINGAAGSEIAVSEETFVLLDACREWKRETGGVFDPLVGGDLVSWGYAGSLEAERPGVAVSPRGAVPGDRGALALDRRRGTVAVPDGALLDLGGIAKSWSARRAGRAAALLSEELSLLVDAGGDLYAVRGKHVVVADAHGPSTVVRVAPGQGVATSGHGRRLWRNDDGVSAHHLIDPFTGRPCGRRHVTVVADDPVAADVLATAIAVRPELAETRAEAWRISEEATSWSNTAWEEVADGA